MVQASSLGVSVVVEWNLVVVCCDDVCGLEWLR